MKKNLKALLALLAAGVMAGALVGCGDQPTPEDPTPDKPPVVDPKPDDPTPDDPPVDPTPEATTSFGIGYGLVHGAGYIGRATVAMNDGKYEDISWDEAELPNQVDFGASDDTIAHPGKHNSVLYVYKTVKYGDVVMNYDAEKKTYMIGDKTMEEFYMDEANAKAYYDAVFAGHVAVVVNGEDDYTKIVPAKFLKTRNEYWDTATASGLGYWANYEKTIAYIKANGLESAKGLEKDGTWQNGDLDTGATWTDLNSDKDNFLSYVQLVELATKNAVTASYANSYGLVHGAGYIAKAMVASVEGKIVSIIWDEAELPNQLDFGASDDTIAHPGKHNSVLYVYKTVKYDDVVMNYDDDKDTYMIGDKTMEEYFMDEANAAKYYEAVLANKVAVVKAGADDTSVLTAKAALKTRNGYWSRPSYSGLGYAINMGRTIEFIIANGLDSAKGLEKDGTWQNGTLDTGATWTDLNSDKDNFLSYVQLVELAASKF